MFWLGLIGGLTHGFHDKRPWEGWRRAFDRSCNVVAAFFVALALLAVGLTCYEEYIAEPRAEARRVRYQECLDAQGPVPYGVMKYPAEYHAAACGHLEP